MLRFLVVDGDDTLRSAIRSTLESRSYQVEEAADGLEAVAMCRHSGHYDAVFIDMNMPKMSGLEALARIREIRSNTYCVMLTACSNVKDAVTAIKDGAYDYLEKPVEPDQILALVDAALEANSMVEVAAYSAPTLQFDEGKNMIGESTSIRKIFDLIFKLSKVETSVLIRGESGTGKELVAQALHYNSHRKRGPFVAVNCGALPETLIESELFGHEKGAFTGADRRKLGKFQYAAGGTIFLDEIGDISLQMQVKLLRVLQEKKFTPVGSNQEIDTDVRIISATNKNLEKLIRAEKFRSDLFYRINVLPIHLPPLRERREDVKQLVDYMINKFNHIHHKSIKSIDKDALNAMRMYNWPGNIRELENVIEHAFIMAAGDKIYLDALPYYIQQALGVFLHGHDSSTDHYDGDDSYVSTAPTPSSPLAIADESATMLGDFTDLKYPILKERFEKEFILRALQAFNGKINQTAEHTQMTKVTLLRKLEKYSINPKDFR